LLSLVSDTSQLFKSIRISYQLVLSEGKSNKAQTEPVNLKSVNKSYYTADIRFRTGYSRAGVGDHGVHSTQVECPSGNSPRAH
jgi:hypothetical protein